MSLSIATNRGRSYMRKYFVKEVISILLGCWVRMRWLFLRVRRIVLLSSIWRPINWRITIISSCLRKGISLRYKLLRILGRCVWWRGGGIMIIDSNWAIIPILWRRIRSLSLSMNLRRISGPMSMLLGRGTIIRWWFGISKGEISSWILGPSVLEIIQREYSKLTKFATQ